MKEKLQHYTHLLLQWNQTHNLSGAKTASEVQENIKDCLYPLEFIASFQSALDIGSGCGFPAVILAIAKPECEFFLTEPRLKRASFLKMLCIELELKNIQIFQNKVQDIKLPHKVDLITSRAVAPTPMLLKLAKPHLNCYSAVLFYKGSKLFNEGEEILPSEVFTHSQRNYFYRRFDNV